MHIDDVPDPHADSERPDGDPKSCHDPGSMGGEAVAASKTRVWILSDLHLDLGWAPFVPTRIPQADVAVVAGDVCQGLVAAIHWVAETIRPYMPVVMVAGNHEYYGSSIDEELAAGAKAAARHGIEFLENRAVHVAGLQFCGSTLWTDYELDGHEVRDRAMSVAADQINDHRLIVSGRFAAGGQRFTPAAAYQRHAASRLFLAQALLTERSPPVPQVVVTHHAPHRLSVDPRFDRHRLNPAFASDLHGLIAAARPALWVHGHIHAGKDYRLGCTRVVCNPLGYGAENAGFDPELVVEVG